MRRHRKLLCRWKNSLHYVAVSISFPVSPTAAERFRKSEEAVPKMRLPLLVCAICHSVILNFAYATKITDHLSLEATTARVKHGPIPSNFPMQSEIFVVSTRKYVPDQLRQDTICSKQSAHVSKNSNIEIKRRTKFPPLKELEDNFIMKEFRRTVKAQTLPTKRLLKTSRILLQKSKPTQTEMSQFLPINMAVNMQTHLSNG